MLRSMFTAISSLNLHQKYLDVVADNLANANTTGYKSSRVLFQTQFAQLLSPGAAPSATAGGLNPTQIGLGVKAGSITPTFTQGVTQSTGRNFDVAINGDGFLMYDHGAERTYSRDGALDLDAAGYLVNSSTGARVQGWTATGGVVSSNAAPGDLQISRTGTLARATTQANIGGNLDASLAVGDTVTTTVAAYDDLGAPLTATIEFERTGDGTWDWNVTGPAGAAGTGTLTFDTTTGQYSAMTGATTITIPTTSGAATPQNIGTLDLSNMTMLSGDSSVNQLYQNGLPAGSVSDVFIAPNTGEVYLYYTNGLKELVGQLAMARFANPSGLLREGNNVFRQGANTGDPEIGTAGTGGRGTLNAGYLEASNVDMAQEFTNMILAQRGFQASSRVITTSDEILQELVNLKR